MNFLKNAHAVPLTELLTLNTLLIFGIVYAIKKYGGCDNNMCMVLAVGLFALSIVVHPMIGMPDNLSRYVGLGEKPDGWRGA